ncbi:hypothetical protein ACOSP7_002419 [Xanthoceras sorbifolium]
MKPSIFHKSDKEKRVRSSTNKDNDPALEGPRAALDFGSAVGTDLPIPSTEVAGSSTFNEVPLSSILFLEKVLRKVLKWEVRSAYQENADGLLGEIVERQL